MENADIIPKREVEVDNTKHHLIFYFQKDHEGNENIDFFSSPPQYLGDTKYRKALSNVSLFDFLDFAENPKKEDEKYGVYCIDKINEELLK